jgi:hypothetical protein
MLGLAVVMSQIPIWANPHLFLSRGNDLENFFWPIFVLYKKSVLSGHGLTLWNPLWFGGQPLISDPQSLLLYPGQLLLVFFPIDIAILLIWFIHSALAGFFAYKAARNIFTSKVALILAILYILSSRLAAAVEAGHFGIILAWTWIPACLLLIQLLSKRVTYIKVVLLGAAISLLVQAHTVTAFLVLPVICVYGLVISKEKRKLFLSLFWSGVIAVGLSAPVLIPQIIWQAITTRYLLLAHPEIFPVWKSKTEFLFYLFPELTRQLSFNTEKIVAIGFVTSIVALNGWLQLKLRGRVITATLFMTIAIFTLNNVSPVSLLITQVPLFQVIRVATRAWPIAVLLVLFLVGKSLERAKPRFFVVLGLMCILNGYFVYVSVLGKVPNITTVPINNVYDYLRNDNDTFRVYCTNRCISQKEAALNNLEIIDGYATLTQNNYYKKSWSMFGGYWDYYSLAIPPFGVGESGKLTPDFDLLGEMNVKYIISPKKIDSSRLTFKTRLDQQYIYINNLFRPRIYVTDDSRKVVRNVQFYGLNSGKITVSGLKDNELITFSTIYSPGWYINGKLINEDPSNIMTMETTGETANIEYKPKSFRYGVIIFFTTIFLLLCGFLNNKRIFSKIIKAVHSNNVS